MAQSNFAVDSGNHTKCASNSVVKLTLAWTDPSDIISKREYGGCQFDAHSFGRIAVNMSSRDWYFT